MANDEKVFCSEITRIDFKENNNLYELLNVIPVLPVPVSNTEDETLLRNFKPICEKNYVSKKRSWLKVRTVREIRNQFEQDNFSLIIEDMEKQQNALLAKIRSGSVSEYSTKMMAKKLLNADHPISRTAWQMLNNINPVKHINPTQFVLWNGKRIRVTGSKGGKNRFICNYDVGQKTLESKRVSRFDRSGRIKKRNGLLCNSLNIKFKPGPLQKKLSLDDSHQKYHMGPAELVELPKPALVIQPACGTVLEPIITSFLHKLRAEDGSISEEWAEFAVSVVGTVKNKNIVDEEKQNCVTFDLKYKYDQNRLLMRHDIALETSEHYNKSDYKSEREKDIMHDIKNVIKNVLDSVEISFKEDELYSTENELPSTSEPLDDLSVTNTKEKNKKKYGELDRLDVTIIRLPGPPKKISSKPCGNSYCNLGCICDSLDCTYKLKQHCGLFECMLGCTCEFSKYKDIELMENGCTELIPGLMKLDSEINCNLAKEELKFHQTVVVRGEESILLKSSKRNLKSSKKYAEFYSNMRLKVTPEPKKILTIVDQKLNSTNIQPWCMVHNLYKCFCQGRFVETATTNHVSGPITKDLENNFSDDHNKIENDNKTVLRPRVRHKDNDISGPITKNLENNFIDDHNKIENDNITVLRPRVRHKDNSENNKSFSSFIEGNIFKEYSRDYIHDSCARTTTYKGRKYKDKYYKITNKKILEMEKNDTQLQKKIMKIMNTSDTNHETCGIAERNSPVTLTTSTDICEGRKHKTVRVQHVIMEKKLHRDGELRDVTKSKPVLPQLVSPDNNKGTCQSEKTNNPYQINCELDEATRTRIIQQEFPKSFEILKQNFLRGKKTTLEGPTKGKIIIHSWEFVLSRYSSKKNIFMVTKSSQHRIFMAVDNKHPFFQSCVNIDTIKFDDLNEYPFVVKYLLTNAISRDHFCILLGWEFCWEIIASVKKNGSGFDPDELLGSTNILNTESEDSVCTDEVGSYEKDDVMVYYTNTKCSDTKSELDMNNPERSRWFIMAIENGFSEIHCHKAGFYVKREQILAAIDLARITNKTVLINKPKEETAFGFYAVPNTNEYSIIVGPYGINAPLGFEAIAYHTDLSKTKKCVKGYWLSTNKVDNEKVLKDPLSFMSPKTVQNDPIKNKVKSKLKDNIVDDISDSTALPSTSRKTQDRVNKTDPRKNKVVKPIKILRTNGFYHLTSNERVIKRITPNSGKSFISVKSVTMPKDPISINDPKSLLDITKYSDIKIVNTTEEANEAIDYTEPSTDASQIRITSVYSESETLLKNKDELTGMFILKPEEINQKLEDCNFNSNSNDSVDNVDDKNEMNELSMDIENFLSSEVHSSTWENDILFISDEDNDDAVNGNTVNIWEYVWIQCTSIKSLGWIRGKRYTNKLLSIDLPGFKHIQWFEENKALNEINRVLSKKVLIPLNIKLEWRVCTLADRHLLGHEIKLQHLTKNHVITDNGIQKLSKLTTDDNEINTTDNQGQEMVQHVNETSELMEGLEETSRSLEDESEPSNEAERKSLEAIHNITVLEI